MHRTDPHQLFPVTPAALWREYRRNGDPRVRDRLVFTLAPLVRHAGADDDVAATAGLQALVAAVEAFAPERDGTIEQFAWSRVRASLGQLTPA